MKFFRPTRGVVRLDDLSFDAEALAADVAKAEAATPWKPLGYGDRWGKIELWRNDFRHPVLEQCPAIKHVIASLPAKVLDVELARLGPGGWVKEHRDISGGVPMGVARFHVPVVTHPNVEFSVNGKPLYLAPGETWNLDTSYRHKLNNRSDVWRVHLIVDVDLNDEIKAMLPRPDIWDAVHRAWFWVICATKGLQLVTKPRQLWRRVIGVFHLRVLGKSSI